MLHDKTACFAAPTVRSNLSWAVCFDFCMIAIN
jgi:hypothetical protein